MALIAGAVIGWIELVEEVAGWIGEGVLLKGEFAIEIEEAGFGADEVLEADFAKGDFVDGGLLEWGLRQVVLDVPGDAIGDLLSGFRVVVESYIVRAEGVLQGVEGGFGLAFRGFGTSAVLGVAEIGFTLFLGGHFNYSRCQKLSVGYDESDAENKPMATVTGGVSVKQVKFGNSREMKEK